MSNRSRTLRAFGIRHGLFMHPLTLLSLESDFTDRTYSLKGTYPYFLYTSFCAEPFSTVLILFPRFMRFRNWRLGNVNLIQMDHREQMSICCGLTRQPATRHQTATRSSPSPHSGMGRRNGQKVKLMG